MCIPRLRGFNFKCIKNDKTNASMSSCVFDLNNNTTFDFVVNVLWEC